MKTNTLGSLWLLVFGFLYLSSHASELSKKKDPWLGWHRPVDSNVFATTMGNNHDSVLFVEPELEYPYYLIMRLSSQYFYLWQGKVFRMRKVQFVAVTGKWLSSLHTF
jgi:hypothetical protein